jgi:hypothetical protein
VIEGGVWAEVWEDVVAEVEVGAEVIGGTATVLQKSSAARSKVSQCYDTPSLSNYTKSIFVYRLLSLP